MVTKAVATDRSWVSFKSGTGTTVFHESGRAVINLQTPIGADEYANQKVEYGLPVGPYFTNVLQVTAQVYPLGFQGADDQMLVWVSATTWELRRFSPPEADQVMLHFTVQLSYNGAGLNTVGYHLVVEADGVVQDVEQRAGEVQGLID